MSIDVFGRQLTQSKIKGRGTRGPPGEGFKITRDGHYDINYRRLCNIADPVVYTDAASVKVARNIVKEETRALYQITTSLRDITDTNTTLIDSLKSELKTNQENQSIVIESLQDLATRNADVIYQLDEKVLKLNDTETSIVNSIANLENKVIILDKFGIDNQNFNRLLQNLENKLNILEGANSDLKIFTQNLKNKLLYLEKNIQENSDKNSKNTINISEIDFQLKELNNGGQESASS